MPACMPAAKIGTFLNQKQVHRPFGAWQLDVNKLDSSTLDLLLSCLEVLSQLLLTWTDTYTILFFKDLTEMHL